MRRVLNAFRSINAYHLFASMTLVRREPIIEGSDDGEHWETYEFRYKPGDPDRAPPFVAPHQPRVDFQLWFLLLGGRTSAPYFDTLLARLLEEPRAVSPLFARDPFPERPPKFVRVAVYRYRFTDVATRRATGAWWSRERLGYSQPLTAQSAHAEFLTVNFLARREDFRESRKHEVSKARKTKRGQGSTQCLEPFSLFSWFPSFVIS